MKASPIEEFLRIVRRDLSAEDARILAAGDEPPEPDAQDLRIELSGGRLLVVTFAPPPPTDLEARGRRLEMLVESFHSVLEPTRGAASASRQPPARSLHEELRALAERAGAHDAIVIDARSPVIWGAALAPQGGAEGGAEGDAEGRGEGERSGEGRAEERPALVLHEVPAVLREVPAAGEGEQESEPEAGSSAPSTRAAPILFIVRAREQGDGGAKEEARDSASDRAIRAVRALPEMATLHKGGQLHHSESGPDLGFVARSFAAIYVLVLAFRGPFEELRAKRAVVHALPIIERLVLALPPQDPAPVMGGVVALRPRLRRRR